MLSAAILAGGQATKFHGVDNSALVIEDRPMLHAALTEARGDGGWHPLCAVHTRGSLARVARWLADGRLKLIDLLADLRVRAVPAEELDRFGDYHHLVANLNTPAEHRDFATLHSHEL